MENWHPFESLDNIVILFDRVDDRQADLFAQEASYVSNAVPARVREFVAGRTLARVALERLGVQSGSIPVGAGRQPVWPDGVTGSITHSASQVGVAVAFQDHYAGIGIDLEVNGGVENQDVSRVLTTKELSFIKDDGPEDYATTIFSCKESAFKAVFPLVGEYFEFQDIGIDLIGNEYRAVPVANLRSANLLVQGRGHVARHSGIVASIFVVKHSCMLVSC
jgi:4'-phosphopantetheinyl transferase EntD